MWKEIIELKHKWKLYLRRIAVFFAVVLCVFSTLLFFSARWAFSTWADLKMAEVVFELKAPLTGTGNGMIGQYILRCVLPSVLVLLLLILFLVLRRRIWHYRRVFAGIVLFFAGLLTYSGYSVWTRLELGDYIDGMLHASTFIEENYTDPADTVIGFPLKKRNLIYIFLESMELTFTDPENGGAFEKNLIPELTELAKTYEDFSGMDNPVLQGALPLYGTSWTMGAMFAQTAGLPLKIAIGGNMMDTQGSFFPGITTLGDILEEQGYHQVLMVGSDAEFGGRELYFREHGNYEILDYDYAKKHGWIPEDYHVFWGFEDEKLFAFAKEELLRLAASGEPFNLTMLTADTHFEDGYVCRLCGDEFGEDQYANVFACSSRQVAAFVRWIQEQDFYENTTIVISGDHETMDRDFCRDVDKNYFRKVYTVYINSAKEVTHPARRNYTTFDAFPTTLAALGAWIEGNRLGLGVSMYSWDKSLIEEYEAWYVNRELAKRSLFMERIADIQEAE